MGGETADRQPRHIRNVLPISLVVIRHAVILIAGVTLLWVVLRDVYSRFILDQESRDVLQIRIDAYIRNVDSTLSALSPDAQGHFIAQMLRQSPPVVMDDSEAARKLQVPNVGWENYAATRLYADSHGTHALRVARDSGNLAVSIQADGKRYWLLIPRAVFVWNSPWPSPLELGFVVLVLLLVIVLETRTQRTFMSLLHATRMIESGGTVPHVKVRGAPWVKEVIRGFNHMASKLRELETERRILLAGISHDLRTPLTRLRLGLEISRRKIENEIAEGMTHDVDEADAILTQFLDYARDDHQEGPVLADINQLIVKICERHKADGTRIKLQLGSIPRFEFKKLAITRVLNNLINNAIAYGKTGIGISTELNGNSVIVKVIDSGPGIPASELAKVTQPFVRASGSSGHAGSGLGLAIAARIAQAHSGSLSVNNRINGGLEVVLCLPYRNQDAF